MHHVQHISVFINRRPAEVYEFASDPRNLPRWAAGLARSEVRRKGDEWVADSPMGEIKIRFAPPNPDGVLDHDVTLESGVTVHNPMRVVPNREGSEFVFTLIRQPGMSDEKFAEDRGAVEKDGGYRWRFDPSADVLARASSTIDAERQCCRFLKSMCRWPSPGCGSSILCGPQPGILQA
jgi:hypothetical protein